MHYVSANAQASFYQALHEEGFFTAEEEAIYKRGRNAHGSTVPKNTDVGIYRISTGFEAILGALYLENNMDRIHTIWDKVRTLQEEKDGTIHVWEKCCKTDTEG